MTTSNSLPKWATPDRKNALVQLWIEYGNKCLYGHQVCSIAEHYQYREAKAVKVAIPVEMPCKNASGTPITDQQGNPLYLTIYAQKTVTTYETKTARLYERKSEQAIKFWLEDDKAAQQTEWQAERLAMHSLGEMRYPVTGKYNAISRDIYASNQPLYYFQGQAVSGLTLTPFIKVRIASSYMRLFIDLGDMLRQVSKSKRRKAIRYGKPLPQEVRQAINRKILEAVKDYM